MIAYRGFLIKSSVFTSLLVLCFFCVAQVNTRAYDDGERFLYSGDYEKAAAAFSHAKNHPAYEYKRVLCALLLGQKTATIEDYIGFEGQMGGSPTYFYWLGQIYIKNQMHYEALGAFNKYLSITKGDSKDEVYTQTKTVVSFLGSVDASINVEKLPSPINSVFMESNACFTGNTEKLVFISERIDEDQFSVYSSTIGQYGWNKPVELTTIYAKGPETINLMPAGNDKFFLKESSSSPVVTLSFDGANLVKGETMETGKLDDAKHFYITENKRKIIFSVETPDNGLDLYECLYLSTSSRWTNPSPVLGEVNTKYDEDYPFVTPDRSKIYFSSDRPGGLGKRDIYFVEIDPVTNQTVKTANLGFPINSTSDDVDFKIYDGKKGSLCSDRFSKSGDWDILIFFGEDLLSQGK